MKNNLLKLLTNDKEIRLYIVDATDMMNRNILQSIKTDTVKQLHKQLVTNCSLMRGLLTEVDQRLSISIRFRPEGCSAHCFIDGNGNINCILSSLLCNYTGEITGLVGKGATLSITRGGWTSGMFTGTVEINNPSVDHFFSYYFSKSDQIETIFKTWTDYECLRGCMIQPLPFADDASTNNVMTSINIYDRCLSSGDWNKIPNIVFPYADVIEEYTIQLECDCSRDMFYGMLMSIDINELKHSIVENRSEELECGICGKRYLFDRDALESIVQEKEKQ